MTPTQTLSKRDSYTGVFLLICEISKNTFFYRAPPVADFFYYLSASCYATYLAPPGLFNLTCLFLLKEILLWLFLLKYFSIHTISVVIF